MTTPRDRLLDAARAVISRDGLEGIGLRAIAREAGVSHGAPLRHFPTLAALLAAVAAWGFEQLVAYVDAEVTAAAAEGVAAVERISRAGVGYLRFAVTEPGMFAVMFRPELCDTSDPGYQAAGQASFEQLAGLVAAGQATGWRPDIPTVRLAALLWADVHGLAELWLHGALPSVLGVGRDEPDELIDLFLARKL